MGLTIHYRFHSNVRDAAAARRLLTLLRRRALGLPLARVDEIVELSGEQCDAQRRGADDPLRWMLIQAGQYVDWPLAGGLHASCCVRPTHLVAFSTWPGEGCEEANFGLARYPASVDVTDPDGPAGRSGWRRSWAGAGTGRASARRSTPASPAAAACRTSSAAT